MSNRCRLELYKHTNNFWVKYVNTYPHLYKTGLFLRLECTLLFAISYESNPSKHESPCIRDYILFKAYISVSSFPNTAAHFLKRHGNRARGITYSPSDPSAMKRKTCQMSESEPLGSRQRSKGESVHI